MPGNEGKNNADTTDRTAEVVANRYLFGPAKLVLPTQNGCELMYQDKS